MNDAPAHAAQLVRVAAFFDKQLQNIVTRACAELAEYVRRRHAQS